MSRNSTYNINEESLRLRFADFEAGFDENGWEELEKNLSEVKAQSNISLGKVNFKLVLIPLLIGLVGFSLYLSRNTLFGNNPESAASLPVENPVPENKNTTPPVVQLKTDSININESAVTKSDVSSTTIKTAPVPGNQESAKISSPVAAEGNTISVMEEKNSISDNQNGKKKKKKRRNGSYDAIETIRTSSLIPSSQDDDVIVPAN
jgi:hypothetical protein